MSRPADRHAKIDLLQAAEAVFVERGLDPAKVEDITGRAGHSKGAFYLHFASKEDAFRQIVETFLARLASCLEDTAAYEPADAQLDPETFLRRWSDKDVEIFDFLWQNRGVVGLMLEGGKSASFAYLIDEFAERNRTQTIELLRAGVREGIYRADLDVEVASLVIAGAYDRVARELVRRPRKPDLAAMLGEVQRLLLPGLASPALARHLDSKVRNSPKRTRAK